MKRGPGTTPEQKEADRVRHRKYKYCYYKTKRGREVHCAQVKRYHRKYPEKTKYLILKRRSRVYGLPFIITKQEFADWFLKQDKRCSYCDIRDLSYGGALLNGRPLVAFSIDRKNPTLPYTLENMAFCCWLCNRLKSNFFNYEQWLEIAQKFIKPRWMADLGVVAA